LEAKMNAPSPKGFGQATLLGIAGVMLLVPGVCEARGVRAAAPTSLQRPAYHPSGGQANISGRTNTAQFANSGNRAAAVNSGNRTNIQGGNRTAVNNQVNSGNRVNNVNNISGNNVNVNRNVNVNNGGDWNRWNDNYHPVATGVAIGATAAVTAAAIGSMYHALPPACPLSPYGGVTYYSCGGVWYAPQYQGDQVVYVVVNNPSG
jgi:hypothetical protein